MLDHNTNSIINNKIIDKTIKNKGLIKTNLCAKIMMIIKNKGCHHQKNNSICHNIITSIQITKQKHAQIG